ncbi:MAG TPA: cytochrome b N-terminal domain-containing protein [Candidatus Binatia bacterium]|jgi:quinol-cytochrome oxidoreductase complex cytochrome b subunit|nr:cytochrome b N-terminal domain-containing protein [Candidatus Binatia bacterium]
MLKRIWKMFRDTRLGRSIFRIGLPESNLERSQVAISSFFLHFQPAKVNRRVLKFRTTLGLGLISLYLFLILVVTGVLLMFYYVPATDYAYQNMKDLEFVVTAGQVLRNMHRWAAHLMVLCAVLHLCRVFYTGAYKPPREFNWVVGVSLLLLTLALSFTGYLLPWDQLAFWAITVGTNIAGYAPIIGKKLQFLFLGGHVVGESALIRFYVLHVLVLPGVITVLIAVHVWRVRKDGGLAAPAEPQPSQEELPAAQLPGTKTYGLMELARGTTPMVGIKPEDEVFTWPNLVFRELLLFMAVSAVVLVLAICFNAPLEEIANPVHPPNPAKAPWYFLGLQELVSYSALWGGVIIPALLVFALLLLPYLDRRRAGVGVWFSRERKTALTLFTISLIVAVILTVIGTFFRGPNWSWQTPWKPAPAVAAEGH